jgi:hypothetical protein
MHNDLNKMKLTLVYILALLILTFVWTELLVGQSLNWESSFDPIALPSITSKNQVSEGSSSAILLISGDVVISAENSAEAQLSSTTTIDTLVTEYKLTFDGNGIIATGGTDTNYETYDTFLKPAKPVYYVTDDDYVKVTLHVKASNYANDLPDAGTYTATQTLTVHWVGP